MMAMVSVVHRIKRLGIAAPLVMVTVVTVQMLLLLVVVVVVVVFPFVSQVYIAPIYAHMFLIMSTNYYIWLIAGETQFTHATQDPDHGAPESPRRTVGPTDNDTPQYSSSSYSDSRHSFHYPIPDISMEPQTRWVYEWEDPHFYTMLVQEWETTSAWTGQSWQDYKAELLRVRGLNVMSIAEYQMASRMGVFPFLR